MKRIAALSLIAGAIAMTGSFMTSSPAQAYCHHWRHCYGYRPVVAPYAYPPVLPAVNPYFAPSMRTRMLWHRGW